MDVVPLITTACPSTTADSMWSASAEADGDVERIANTENKMQMIHLFVSVMSSS
jgi:hypothetical protein